MDNLDLSTFQVRYNKGVEAENLFEQYLIDNHIPYTKFINESYWSISYDLVNGDFLVNGERFDIKRNAISFKSLDNFAGKYFIVYHYMLHTPIVIEAAEIKKMNRNYFDTLMSGDPGFKYYRLKNLKHWSLDQFFK